MPDKNEQKMKQQLDSIFENHLQEGVNDNIQANRMQQDVGSINREQELIDRFLGMKAMERSRYMSEAQEYKLQAIRGRNFSQLMLKSEKIAGDSTEMQEVKNKITSLEIVMSPTNIFDGNRDNMLQQVDGILVQYTLALNACLHYISKKNPWFYSSRKKMVEDTFKRLTDEKSRITVARKLIEAGLHNKYAGQQVELKTPMDLLVLGQMEHSPGIDEVEETRTEVAAGVHLLCFDDFMSLFGEKNRGVVTFEKGRLVISGNSGFANLSWIRMAKVIFGGDDKPTVANQQMRSRLYEIAAQKLGRNHPYLGIVREKLEIGGLKSGSLDRKVLVNVLAGIARWSSASLSAFDSRMLGKEVSDEQQIRESLGKRALRLFGAGDITDFDRNPGHEVTKQVRQSVGREIKSIVMSARKYGISLPSISDREMRRLVSCPTLLADIAYEAELGIVKQINVLEGRKKEQLWNDTSLTDEQKEHLQILSLKAYLAKTEEQKLLSDRAMKDFVMKTAFSLLGVRERNAAIKAQKKKEEEAKQKKDEEDESRLKEEKTGQDEEDRTKLKEKKDRQDEEDESRLLEEEKSWLDEENLTGEKGEDPRLSPEDIYSQLREVDVPLLNEGSEGLEQALSSVANSKVFLENQEKLNIGKLLLTDLCDNMSAFSRLRDKGLREGLTKKEIREFKDAGNTVDSLMKEENLRSIEFVARELKNTRFWKGFETFEHIAYDISKDNFQRKYSYERLAESLAKRLLRGEDNQEEGQNLQPDLQQGIQLDLQLENSKKIEISNGEALDRLEEENKAGSTLFKVLLMQQQPCDYIKNVSQKEQLRIAGEFWELRNVLTLMPKDRACIRSITISGQSFKLVQKQDNSLLASLNGHTIALNMTARSISRVIESDMMSNSSLYGSTILRSFSADLSTGNGELGLRRYSRDMFVKYMAGLSGKPETFFNNLDPILAEQYARRIMDAEPEKMEAVLNEAVSSINLLNSRYILNNEETLTLVSEMKEHRKDEVNSQKVVYNNAPVNARMEQNANDWTPAQKKVINLLADFIFPEDTWETDRINSDIGKKVDDAVNAYRLKRIDEITEEGAFRLFSEKARESENQTPEHLERLLEECRRTAREETVRDEKKLLGEELKQRRLLEEKLQSETGDRARISKTLVRNIDGLIEIIRDEKILASVLGNLPPQVAQFKNQIQASIGDMLNNEMIQKIRTGLVPELKQAKLKQLDEGYKTYVDDEKAREQKFYEELKKENEEIDRYNARTEEENSKKEKRNAALTEEFRAKLEEENRRIREKNASVTGGDDSLPGQIEKEIEDAFVEKFKHRYNENSAIDRLIMPSIKKVVYKKYANDKRFRIQGEIIPEKTLKDTLEDGSKLVLEEIKPLKKHAVRKYESDLIALLARRAKYVSDRKLTENMNEASARKTLLKTLSGNNRLVVDMLSNIQNKITGMLNDNYSSVMGGVQDEIKKSVDEVFGGGRQEVQQQEQVLEGRQEVQRQEQVLEGRQDTEKKKQEEERRREIEDKLEADDDYVCTTIADIARKAGSTGSRYPQNIVEAALQYLEEKKRLEKARDIETYRQKYELCKNRLGDIRNSLKNYSGRSAAHERYMMLKTAESVMQEILELGKSGGVIEKLTEKTRELAGLKEKLKAGTKEGQKTDSLLEKEDQEAVKSLETEISEYRTAIKNVLEKYRGHYANFISNFQNNISRKEMNSCKTVFNLVLQNKFNQFVTSIMDDDFEAEKLMESYRGSFSGKDREEEANTVLGACRDYLRSHAQDSEPILGQGMLDEVSKVIDKKLAAMVKLVEGDTTEEEDEDEKEAKIKKRVGELVLDNMVKTSLGGDEGQGKFLKTVLSNYFRLMNKKDGLNMFASSVRNLKPGAKLEDGRADEKANMANYLSGFLKGAGPLLQKLLQGMPTAGMPKELSMALRDMKENLAPIPGELVEAQMRGIVERSGGEISKIEIIRSLGAASVGQAFMCRVYGRNGGQPDNVVIKLLRPDVKNRLEREKEVLIACARMTDGTQDMAPDVIGGMEATYRGVLARIEEEMDLTIEAGNVMTGAIYDVGYENIGAMKLYNKVKPTQNTMVLDIAEGETLQKYFDRTGDYIKNTDFKKNIESMYDDWTRKDRSYKMKFQNLSEKYIDKHTEIYRQQNSQKYEELTGKVKRLKEEYKKDRNNKKLGDELEKAQVALKKFNDEADKYANSVLRDGKDPEYVEEQNNLHEKLTKLHSELVKNVYDAIAGYTEELDNLQKRQKHVEQMATKWILEGIYNSGFYHGDLHAGNIMISDNKATFIDFGNATKLDESQREKVVRMMIAATIGDMDIFRHNFHALLQASSETKYQEVRGQLGDILNKVFSLGDSASAGKRILTALCEAQKLGLEIPSEIYNFSQSQQRLQNTLDEMNQYIEDMRKKFRELAQYVDENNDININCFEKFIAITKQSPNSFMDIMAGILSTHLKASIKQFGFGNTLSNISRLQKMI